MIMNSGMMLSCVGTIIVPTTRASSRPLPRKRSLAKAKPASVQHSTVPTVIALETMSELTIALPIGACVERRPDVVEQAGAGQERRRGRR